MGIKHHYQSNKADSADTGIVRPSNWNEEHDYTDLNPAKILQDATHRFVGDSYNDLALPIHPKETGAGQPTLRNFDTNVLRLYTMAIDDVSVMEPTEILHGWIEGTSIEVHVHWATRGVDITDMIVKWEVWYTWANKLSKGGVTAFGAIQSLSAETTIPANTTDKTHMYTSLGSIAVPQGLFGAYLLMSIKRIAASGAAPTTDPWVLAVGVHYQVRNIGSSSII